MLAGPRDIKVVNVHELRSDIKCTGHVRDAQGHESAKDIPYDTLGGVEPIIRHPQRVRSRPEVLERLIFLGKMQFPHCTEQGHL